MNIRFEYLYRDAGNFKRWGDVVFSNRRDVPVDAIVSMADRALIDHLFFDADKVGVPDLHFAEHVEALDHGWHEASGFTVTSDAPTDAAKRDIEEFVGSLLQPGRTGTSV